MESGIVQGIPQTGSSIRFAHGVSRRKEMSAPISSNPKIANLYRDIPQEALQPLQSFRQRYAYQSVILNGIDWHYIDTQAGDTILFIPAAGTLIAEVDFKSIDHFAQRYRVIAPDYPPIDNLEQLFAGFLSLLDYLSVNHFFALGGSYGGLMIQSLVRMFPERVRKLVIAAIGPPSKENIEQIARVLPWPRITPTFLLRWMINRSFAGLVSQQSSDPNMSVIRALIKEVVYYRLEREDILTALDRLIDQTRNYTFSAHDLKDWPGNILLVFGSQDPVSPPEIRKAMRVLYPQAEIKIIEGGEHGLAISHQDEFYGAIDEFLARGD
jgi:pimeloyl-ACP methyl ester carboxylesterase